MSYFLDKQPSSCNWVLVWWKISPWKVLISELTHPWSENSLKFEKILKIAYFCHWCLNDNATFKIMTRNINRHSKECPKGCCVIEWPQKVWLKPLRVFQELALAMGKNREMGEVLTYVYVLLLPIFVPKLITLNHWI